MDFLRPPDYFRGQSDLFQIYHTCRYSFSSGFVDHLKCKGNNYGPRVRPDVLEQSAAATEVRFIDTAAVL